MELLIFPALVIIYFVVTALSRKPFKKVIAKRSKVFIDPTYLDKE